MHKHHLSIDSLAQFDAHLGTLVGRNQWYVQDVFKNESLSGSHPSALKTFMGLALAKLGQEKNSIGETLGLLGTIAEIGRRLNPQSPYEGIAYGCGACVEDALESLKTAAKDSFESYFQAEKDGYVEHRVPRLWHRALTSFGLPSYRAAARLGKNNASVRVLVQATEFVLCRRAEGAFLKMADLLVKDNFDDAWKIIEKHIFPEEYAKRPAVQQAAARAYAATRT